jgi:hypothetical protein
MPRKRQKPVPSEEGPPETALTFTPERIHSAATDDGGRELDQMAVNHFIDTIAEIAVAVAARSTVPAEKEQS